MKMLNIFSKNNVARDTFKEVSEFMETSNFEEFHSGDDNIESAPVADDEFPF